MSRARYRRPALSCGRADGGTNDHNTLSADNADVQVFHPFHPLHGVTLRIVRRPKRGDGAVCVMDPAGRRLKIPVWMLLPECAEITISQQPHLGQQALSMRRKWLSARFNRCGSDTAKRRPGPPFHSQRGASAKTSCKACSNNPATSRRPQSSASMSLLVATGVR